MTRRSVKIPNSTVMDFTSLVNNRRYSISVAMPIEPTPPSGSPVLYVIDGYGYFASATEAVRANGNAPTATVVGIGYPDAEAHVVKLIASSPVLPSNIHVTNNEERALLLQRMYDLTLPASDETLRREAGPNGTPVTVAHVGGLDDFLQMIETDIKPRVARVVAVDSQREAIFGHSLGGLAVLHALFTRPAAYRSFIIASPSIWWSGRAVLKNEAAFQTAIRRGKLQPRVLITVGEDEDHEAAAFGADESQTSMVVNARELTARLRQLASQSRLHIEDLAVFARQGHGISPWPALGRAVPFAFRQ